MEKSVLTLFEAKEIRLHRKRASLREKDALKLNTKGASKVDEFTDQLDAFRK